jgi:hydrogenase small subunit
MSTTTTKRDTYYESISKKGHSRRDFVKFAAFMAAYMGLKSSAIGQIAEALKTTPRLPVIWEHFQECTCCSESFIRSDHPIVADIILDNISLDYSLTINGGIGASGRGCKKRNNGKIQG